MIGERHGGRPSLGRLLEPHPPPAELLAKNPVPGHGQDLDGASLLAHDIGAQEVCSVDFVATLNTILLVFLQDYSCNPGWVTSKPEVIGSSVGLVSRNAPGSGDPCCRRKRRLGSTAALSAFRISGENSPSHHQPGSRRRNAVSVIWRRTENLRSAAVETRCECLQSCSPQQTG